MQAILYKCTQERFNTRRGWFVNAFRLLDPETKNDLVQPWFDTKKEALDYAKHNSISIVSIQL